MELFYAALAVVLGLVALVYGADRFVLGAATAAHRLGVSPLVVGVLVVGLGTSAPEMLVSAVAAYNERGGMAVGNAVGSNISNIGLVLGTAALIAPIDLRASVIRRELPILLLVTGGTLAVLYDARVSRLDGVLLLVAFVVYLVRTFRVGGASASGDPPAEESPAEEAAAGEGDEPPTTGAAAAWLVFGLALLLGGSRAVVWGASNVAQAYGVSDLVIGLTVVAIGTSLPELAASVTSAIKGHHDLAVGNVIGSNTFNLLAVLSIPGLLHPEPVDPEVVTRDYVVMGAMTVLLFLMARGFRARGRINRWEGLTLLLCFIGYMTWVGTHAAG